MQSLPVVGILGGMGPLATVAFLDKIVTLTPAKKDWEHIRLIVDNNPHIPSRTRHVLYGEPSPVPGIIDSCAKLSAYPVDFITIPCNSACAFIEEIRAGVSVPIVDIVEVAVDALKARYAEVRTCAVIGGRVPYVKGTYRTALAKHGIEYIEHDEALQKEVEDVIESTKLVSSTASTEASCMTVLNTFIERYTPDAVILGCTEFGCLHPDSVRVPLVDSSHELAAYVVNKVKGHG